MILVVAAIVSFVCHKVISHFVAACVVSTLLASFMGWYFTQSHFGWLDQDFYTNLALTVIPSAVISVVVGSWVRSRRDKGQSQPKNDLAPPAQ